MGKDDRKLEDKSDKESIFIVIAVIVAMII